MLDAALALLGSGGVEAVTVRAVAAGAGCSTIGVYTHFGDKAGLVEALLVDGFDAFSAAVAVVDRGGSDGVERLVAGSHAYRDWALANRPLYLLMFSPAPPAPAVRREVLEHGGLSRADHEARVRRAVELGELRSGDLGWLADATWAHVHGWVMLELTGPMSGEDPAPRRAAFDGYARALLAGLAPPSAGP